MIGKPFEQCAWWTSEETLPARIRDAMDKAFAGEKVRFDVDMFCKENDRLAIDFMIAPVLDDDAKVTYLIFSGVDISERKIAELELAESNERLAIAMSAAKIGWFDWEPDSDEIKWDEQHMAITGLTSDDSTGKSFLDRVHPDDVENCRRAIQRAIQGEADYDTQFRFIRRDGQVRWLAARGQIVPSRGERPLRFIGLNWDITDLRRQESKIRESQQVAEDANQSKSEFLANMSHEIRTPMSAILGYADILDRHVTDPDDLDCIRVIRKNGNFLLDIINDILDISKVEAGKLEIIKRPIRVDQMIADVQSLMSVRAEEKSYCVRCRIQNAVCPKQSTATTNG